MEFTDIHTIQRTMELSVEKRHRQAEALRLARQVSPPHRQGMSRQYRLFVCDLGYMLVSLGARLVEYGLPPYYPAEANARKG